MLVTRTDVELAAGAGLVRLVVGIVEATLPLSLLELEASLLYELLDRSLLLGRQADARLRGRSTATGDGRGARGRGDREVKERGNL